MRGLHPSSPPRLPAHCAGLPAPSAVAAPGWGRGDAAAGPEVRLLRPTARRLTLRSYRIFVVINLDCKENKCKV